MAENASHMLCAQQHIFCVIIRSHVVVKTLESGQGLCDWLQKTLQMDIGHFAEAEAVFTA